MWTLSTASYLDNAAPEAVDHGVEPGGGHGEGLSKYRGDEDAAEAEHSTGLHQPGNIVFEDKNWIKK